MASKKKTTKPTAPQKKAETAAPAKRKAATIATAGRHPRARVADAHGGKAALAKSLAVSLARPDEDTGHIEERLKTASNAQLLRLHKAVTVVKEKWGDRQKLIAAIGTATRKATDKDYLAKLDTYTLPQLVELARTSARR